jgi:formamidopyrimidine-DNA glycosylase
LPDVEGFRRTLDGVAGRRIDHVEVADAQVVRGVAARRFAKELAGRRLGHPYRHGKWLVAPTDGPTVMLHFGMTGGLFRTPAGGGRHPHDRLVFVLDGGEGEGKGGKGGELHYRDQRKLQGVRLADDAEVRRTLDDLGPDALTIGEADFAAALAAHRGRVKAVLIDQSAIAGLGNLLADEILWRARVHPSRPAREADAGRLHAEMRSVLRSATRAGRVPPRPGWLTGHRDAPDPHCPRCGTPLTRARVAGRPTVWCPRCQRERAG